MTLQCVIVDDSPRILRTLSAMLERQGMAVVGLARTGHEALSVVQEVEADVVLVDIGLGSDSGFDLARRLGESVDIPGPRTILISTHEETDFEDLIAVSPAIGFLSKSDLSVTAIHRLMERHGGEGVH